MHLLEALILLRRLPGNQRKDGLLHVGVTLSGLHHLLSFVLGLVKPLGGEEQLSAIAVSPVALLEKLLPQFFVRLVLGSLLLIVHQRPAWHRLESLAVRPRGSRPPVGEGAIRVIDIAGEREVPLLHLHELHIFFRWHRSV